MNIPSDIIEAAYKLENWFLRNDIWDWQLGGVCSVISMKKDRERLNYLDDLKGRYVMTPCFKSVLHPDGLRKDYCRSDIHLGGDQVSIYKRDDLANAVASATSTSIREAIDKLMEG